MENNKNCVSYSGRAKNEFCERLGKYDWKVLADLIGIKPHEQDKWPQGEAARAIWEWLEQKKRLGELADNLSKIQRSDLTDMLNSHLAPPTSSEPWQDFYQRCKERWSAPRFALDTCFVDLTLLLDQGADAQGPRWKAKSENFQSLQEVLTATPEPLVLLGAPGCGKSTLLRNFELENAKAALEKMGAEGHQDMQLTFFIQLNEFKGARESDPAPLPLQWLSERWAKRYPQLPQLTDLMQSGQMTLLLDALNEIPNSNDELIVLWADFLSDLQLRADKTRVIFSCRSLDYSAKLSTTDRPVQQVRIESLSDGKVEQFLQQYSPEHGEILWKNLKHTAQLNIFRSPYFLKMLIDESIDGEIPSGRAALFTAFVRRLLWREIKKHTSLFEAGELLHERDIERLIRSQSGKTAWELPKRGILLTKLSVLAYRMQCQHNSEESGQVKVDYDLALELLEHTLDEQIIKAGITMDVLEQDWAQDQIYYIHQLIQEYFSAQHFAISPEPQLAQQEWQAERVSPSLAEILAALPDSDPLPLLPTTGWEETLAMASAMQQDPDPLIAELMTTNLALAGRCAAQPDVSISDTQKTELQQALVQRTQNPEADLRARIAAGFSLGELGDPRLQKGQGVEGEFLLPLLSHISAGTYLIGSDEGLNNDEAPAHQVKIKAFQMAQCPVTNAEYRLFIEAGGYEDERWWITQAAQAWHRGENTAEGPKQQVRDNRKYLQENSVAIREWVHQGKFTSKQAEDWEQIAQWSDDAFEEWLTTSFPGGQLPTPAQWHDGAFNSAAQPVVGICVYEAQAYCHWLSHQSGLSFRLPGEAEWEASARGSAGRRYAYGEEFNVELGNTFESHIRATTPCGVFPGGNTPDGLLDMSGNVWEWTSSLYKAYPYDANDGRENRQSGDDRRVVRGGSWSSYQDYARAAYRNYFTPGSRYDNLGFRVLCSSPIT